MRIEELIIDGFKSYPVRTHVRGFDPSFNAITGLNGSGKSNILDAICFVLGITNLSSVRAANIQDLIYKRGQAGVTKASVTIVFDNADRERSPVSFENYKTITVTRQIAMGGGSKYLINGHKATQQAVQNLFQSVQLNINNPNFLIMQGKITKVLNMKPAETLSMIEEAAGTRMFEERKERAFRTMAKKDQKVREITALLEEEITPKLDRLREEKRSFLEYQKATSELERLTRLAKAHEWQSHHTQLRARSEHIDAHVRGALAARQAEVAEWTRQMHSIQRELEQLAHRREEELARGGRQHALLERARALAHELVEANTQYDFKRALAEDEARRAADEAQAVAAAADALAQHEAGMAQLRDAHATHKQAHDAAAARSAAHEELLQTLLTGVASGGEAGGAHAGFQGQLARARADEAAARTEMEQLRLRTEHVRRELRAKEPLAEREAHENRGAHAELAQARDALAAAEQAHAALGFDDAAFARSREERGALDRRVAQLMAERDALRDALPAALQFTYADPGAGFDRSRVKGLVASLLTLRDAQHATALETCAGSRLYNVVVEDEQVGAALLARGQLRRRVTLIPLNKIQAGVAPAARVDAAKRLAPAGGVHLALTLVGYAEEVAAALEYVFGNTLVCRDAATAQRVTFDAAVRMKSVTLQGDVYDPAGTLSGGSQPAGAGSVLLRLQEVAALEERLANAQAELRAGAGAWDALQRAQRDAARAADDVALQAHRVSLLEERLGAGGAGRAHAEVAAHRQTLAELEAAAGEAARRRDACAGEAARLEREIQELGQDKDAKLASVRRECKEHKAALAEHAAALKERHSALRTAELELEQLRADHAAAEERAADARGAHEAAERERDEAGARRDALQAESQASDAAVAQERAALSAFDEETAQLERALAGKRQAVADAELASAQLAHELEHAEQECGTLRRALEALEAEHPWIAGEQARFGEAGSAYDFARHNMADVRRLCRQLEEQQSGMRRRVNPKVMNTIDNVEKKEAALQHMLSTVLRDKSKIEQTIQELEHYKKDALQATYTHVDRDFGEIFGELLPGNSAALRPPEGADVTQGLEVRVRLGQVWKQSLTELSGGQRSLIALSLILSLLQFKPAPMYILDEIDAALDLQHTQHIGQLFRTRFRGSQFIVVSLKEGLFTNANVLFRARFRDGTSIVERITQRGADKENARTGVRSVSGKRLVSGPRVASGGAPAAPVPPA